MVKMSPQFVECITLFLGFQSACFDLSFLETVYYSYRQQSTSVTIF